MNEADTSLTRKLTRYDLTPAKLVTVATTEGKHAIEVPTFTNLVAQHREQYSGRDRGTQGKLDFWIERFGNKLVVDMTEFDVDDGLIELSRRHGGNMTLTGSSLKPDRSALSVVLSGLTANPTTRACNTAIR